MSLSFIWTQPRAVLVPEQYFKVAGSLEVSRQRILSFKARGLKLPPSRSGREAAAAAGAFQAALQESTNFLLLEICLQFFSHSEVMGSRRHWLDMIT